METKNGLLTSAKQFLVEALSNKKGGKRNFAILHAVTAIELVLKERLAKIHPALIFRNIDAPSFRGEQTIALSKLPQRLCNLGVQIDPKESSLISRFVEWRNQIVHHMPSFDVKTADSQFPRLLDFFANFIRHELNVTLESFLPKQLYKIAATLLKDWGRVVNEARDRALKEGNILSDPCPDCGSTEVLCLREEKRVYCHLCKTQLYRYDRCTQCGRQTVSTFSSFDEGNYCDECIDAAGDYYIQMMIDLERGK